MVRIDLIDIDGIFCKTKSLMFTLSQGNARGRPEGVNMARDTRLVILVRVPGPPGLPSGLPLDPLHTPANLLSPWPSLGHKRPSTLLQHKSLSRSSIL